MTHTHSLRVRKVTLGVLSQQFLIHFILTKLSCHILLVLKFQLALLHVIIITVYVCVHATVLITSVDVNDPAALSLSVSLSYLLAAYLIQGISSLFQAVLTFRQAGPFQRELLAHARLDNLVVSETCFPPSFPRLSVAPVSLSLSCLFISVCSCLFLSSPFLS